MTLSDNLAVRQVIGCLMHNTLLLLEYLDLENADFENEVARICFVGIKNLYKQGATKLSTIEVENEILKIEGSQSAAIYNSRGGLEFLKVCYEIAELDNFELYYKRVKKLALLRCLKKAHYDISYYYKEDNEIQSPLEEVELQERLDAATLDEILNNVEGKYNEIRNHYLGGGQNKGDAAEGIYELIEELRQNPDNGPMLEGDIFSLVTRGARAGKMYIRSALSSGGKTRTAIFDACRLVYPIRYSIEKGTFIEEIDEEWKPIKPRKILFIVTEMDKDEIQTIILAYLSGVNEEHILRNRYEIGELERIAFAAQIMQHYSGYFLIETISDPNLDNVEATIKKYVTIDNVKYIGFDYIHTTASMMSQFTKSGLREDVVLMLMANQLKQIAKDYNIFIFSATQVNAAGMDNNGDFKDATSIRGSKAIADKADAGYVITKINEKMWDSFVGDFRKGAREGYINSKYIEEMNWRPTHVLDIYKNRRGKLKDVRIWCKIDLGTGFRKDLFITTPNNQPIQIPDDMLYTTRTQIINWRAMLESGVIE